MLMSFVVMCLLCIYIESERKIEISIIDIHNYFHPAQRPIILGEEIVNSQPPRIISIGIEHKTACIVALVVRSTSFTLPPHEIKINDLHLKVNDWKCICSCKAGSGEKCKHIAGALIYINR